MSIVNGWVSKGNPTYAESCGISNQCLPMPLVESQEASLFSHLSPCIRDRDNTGRPCFPDESVSQVRLWSRVKRLLHSPFLFFFLVIVTARVPHIIQINACPNQGCPATLVKRQATCVGMSNVYQPHAESCGIFNQRLHSTPLVESQEAYSYI